MQRQYKTRAELKSEVKNRLKGNWGTAVKLNLIPSLFTILGMLSFSSAVMIIYPASYQNLSGYISANNGFGETIGEWIVDFIFLALAVGIQYTFLNWMRNESFAIRPLGAAFSVFSRKYFVGVFLLFIITKVLTALWSLLLIIPGIIKSYAYSQTYLVFKDHTDTDGEDANYMDCITESRQLMNGNKWRYFVLQLSFIGWGILSVLTLGIGLLWLNPYMNATYAAFYKDLKENN